MNSPYEVLYSEAVRNELKDLHARAVQKDRGPQVLAAARKIDERLHSNPTIFGEPKFHYQTLKLELRVGIEPPLVVHFTVHEERPLVIVKSLRSLPGQGF